MCIRDRLRRGGVMQQHQYLLATAAGGETAQRPQHGHVVVQPRVECHAADPHGAAVSYTHLGDHAAAAGAGDVGRIHAAGGGGETRPRGQVATDRSRGGTGGSGCLRGGGLGLSLIHI